MRTDPINNSENKTFSVPKAGIAGAALGYLSTYAVPLTTEEHAKYFTKSVQDGIKAKGISARRNEIEAIVNEFKGGNIAPLVKDTFEKSKEALENAPKELIANLHNDTSIAKADKSSLLSLFKRVENSGKITEMMERAHASLAAKKDSRAALYFALIGGLALMSFAIIKNSIETLFPKPEKKPVPDLRTEEMKDLDFIIESGEIPAEIYIFGFGGGGKKAKNKA